MHVDLWGNNTFAVRSVDQRIRRTSCWIRAVQQQHHNEKPLVQQFKFMEHLAPTLKWGWRIRMKLKGLTGDQKKGLFLLVLTASVIFLLTILKDNNFDSLYKMVTVCLLPTTPSTRDTPKSEAEVQRCSYKYLFPENAEEGRRLLDSITWPETLPLPKPFSLQLTTSASKSTFSIVPQTGGWRVGGELVVKIQLKDFYGNPKKSGGDFLSTRLHNRQLGAGVVGQVQDHLNGTFTARFPLLWNGTAAVEVTLVQTSEAITIVKRLTEEQPERVAFGSDFKSGSISEKTTCNVCLDPHNALVCNFTDLNTGEQWFCYKPKTLDCDTRFSHFKEGIHWRISDEEATLFQNGINVKVHLTASGNTTIMILPKTGESDAASPGPSGYYFNNQWRPLGGAAVREFNSASAITACLKGKQVHLFGDSTVRQYYSHITDKQPNLQRFEKYGSPQCGPKQAIDFTNDIVVTFRCHGPPLRAYPLPVSQHTYVANELDRIPGGPDTVVVVGVWTHFCNFPMEVYYQRLVSIHKAVRRLLNRAPGTKVIIRSGNMKVQTLSECLTNSDWFSLQMDKVLRAVFKDSGVFLLEAWEMVQAHHFPHNIHPPPPIIKFMVDQILSQACPGGGV